MKKDLVGWAAVAAAGIYALYFVPRANDATLLINGTVYASYAVLALSLALVWGYAGILSFGQTAFFGLGGYVYAIVALNSVGTPVAAVVAIFSAAVFAALLGYFMFWGRLSDVYLGVVTLTVSLILYRFINQTAGDVWTIGQAPLGGFNGIPSTPILQLPGAADALGPEQVYVLSIVVLIVCYIVCRGVLASRFGRVVIAIRESEVRAELLGYDARFYKLGVFTIGGAIAGSAGVLFANCVLVSPNMFSLFTSGQLLIWVIVGGLGTLAGPVVGCFLVLMLSTALGTVSRGGLANWLDPNLVLGIVLTLFVMIAPKGLLPLTLQLWSRARGLIHWPVREPIAERTR